MTFRPLSFTKNLGGLQNLHRIIREAYLPGISLPEFSRRIPRELQNRRLVVEQFFIATRVEDGVEYVVQDALVSWSLSQPWNVTTARIYLFSLILNMPGQRLKEAYRSPAGGQNEFVRTVLHDGQGWRASALDKDESIEPWVRANVELSGAARKYTTNLYHFFDQCRFPVSANGYLLTDANSWAPLALRLFFDRLCLYLPNPSVDELVTGALGREIHKLLGVPVAWLSQIVDGAAVAYSQGATHVLTATEPASTASTAGPAGRRTVQVNRLIRATANKVALASWYRGTCQICGASVRTGSGQSAIDYAHVQPLGLPHNGSDDVANMLSLCPNHHRQFDRGAITIQPGTFAILAPHGSAPATLATLQLHPKHGIGNAYLQYHVANIFRR